MTDFRVTLSNGDTTITFNSRNGFSGDGFVVTKEAEDGLTDERTFWWFAEATGPLEGTTPVRKTRSQGTGGRSPRHGSKGPHQMAEPSDNGYGSAIPSPPPYPAPANAGPDGAGPERFVPPPAPIVDDGS